MAVRGLRWAPLVWGLGLCFLGAAAEGRSFRLGQIPNGGINGCSTCHMSARGGDARNAFGRVIEAQFLDNGNVVWGPELAALDSDADGFSNGEELGDPEGAWRAGDDNPGAPEAVTKPWDPDSHPPAPVTPTAVAATSWARIKEAVRGALD